MQKYIKRVGLGDKVLRGHAIHADHQLSVFVVGGSGLRLRFHMSVQKGKS